MRAVVAQALSLQTQIMALLALLGQGEEAAESACEHPDDERMNMRTMGAGEHWRCRLCGHEYREPGPG